MKRKTWKKRRLRDEQDLLRMRLRELDRHDRAYLLTFMRGAILTLAREDIDVNSKVITLASVARRLAPSIMTERQRSSHAKDGGK